MYFEPVEKLQMNQPGKSLLKSIQDNQTPLADLLVRESIQNSTDAAKDGVDKVIVDFSAGKFDAQSFSSHLDGIKEKLCEYYPESSYDFLCIRDWNTRGLGGRIIRTTASEIKNDDSFTKLVYGVGYSQEQSGAGGSWGLGKTVYYSVGNGIVLYYSWFKENDWFAEGLAVCLIEDHEK